MSREGRDLKPTGGLEVEEQVKGLAFAGVETAGSAEAERVGFGVEGGSEVEPEDDIFAFVSGLDLGSKVVCLCCLCCAQRSSLL